MEIIYNKKTELVVASTSSNVSASTYSPAVLHRMFPDCHQDLECVSVDLPQSMKVIGATICLEGDVAYKLTMGDKILFEMTEEKLREILDKKTKVNKKKLLSSFPLVCTNGSVTTFLDTLERLPQTLPEIKESLSDGSYLNKPVIPVGWWGSFTDAGGYACMNRELITRLHNHHIVPYVKIYKTHAQVEPNVKALIQKYSNLRPRSRDHQYVYAFTPMPHDHHRGKRIFFTMMETFTLHQDFTQHCNRFSDEVWVPSRANMELFKRGGVKKKIRVVPLGIDETIYLNPRSEHMPLDGLKSLFGRPPEKGVANFKFLSLFQWNIRKGYDALIKSFVNSFDDKDDVCLVITTQNTQELVFKDLECNLPRSNHLPQVLLYNDIIPAVKMPGFYRNFDCYVHMSRGEGFSLTQIEAAACGVPVISTYHSGMTEYLHEGNSFTIECKETELAKPNLANVCYFYQGQWFWKVGQNEIDMASAYMKWVVENYTDAAEKANLFRKEIEEKYTWKEAASRVAKCLGAP